MATETVAVYSRVLIKKDGGKILYRNPDYWQGEIEDCDKVEIYGDYPEIEAAYKKADIEVVDLKPKRTRKK